MQFHFSDFTQPLSKFWSFTKISVVVGDLEKITIVKKYNNLKLFT